MAGSGLFIPLKSSMYQSFLLMLFPSPPPLPHTPLFPPFPRIITPSCTTKLPLKPPYALRPPLTTGHSPRPADSYTACIPRFLPVLLRPFSAETLEIHPNLPKSAGTHATHKYHTQISNTHSPSYVPLESIPYMVCTTHPTRLRQPPGTPTIPASNEPLYVPYPSIAPIPHPNDQYTWQVLPYRFPFYPSVLWKITREGYPI